MIDGLLLDGMLSEYEEAFKAADKSGNGTIGAWAGLRELMATQQPQTESCATSAMPQRMPPFYSRGFEASTNVPFYSRGFEASINAA